MNSSNARSSSPPFERCFAQLGETGAAFAAMVRAALA